MAKTQFHAFVVRAALAATLVFVGAASAASAQTVSSPSRTLDASTRFFVPPPTTTDPLRQIADLLRQRRIGDVLLIGALESQARAVWFTRGTPASVRADIQRTVLQARARAQV